MLIEIYSHTQMCSEKKKKKISFYKNEHHLAINIGDNLDTNICLTAVSKEEKTIESFY